MDMKRQAPTTCADLGRSREVIEQPCKGGRSKEDTVQPREAERRVHASETTLEMPLAGLSLEKRLQRQSKDDSATSEPSDAPEPSAFTTTVLSHDPSPATLTTPSTAWAGEPRFEVIPPAAVASNSRERTRDGQPNWTDPYAPTFPTADFPGSSVRSLLADFYRCSDNPAATETWLGYFADDATIVMGGDRAHGADEIRRLRARMWESIAERRHSVEKAFPAKFTVPAGPATSTSATTVPTAGEGWRGATRRDPGEVEELELMLFGEVRYVFRTGERQAASWSGHAVLRRARKPMGSAKDNKIDGRWEFAHYRVWIQR